MFAKVRSWLLSRSARRSLDEAGGDRRWADNRSLVSARAIEAGAGLINARGALVVANNATAARIIEALKASVIGTGLKPRSRIKHEATRARVQAALDAWIDNADADELTDFFGLQAALFGDMAVLGEGLAVFLADPVTGAPQLRRLHPEQLDRSLTRLSGTGGQIVQGVEFDARGRRIAYHIKMPIAGDPLSIRPLSPQRFLARDVIHLFRALMPGQVRGISMLAPILLPLRELDALIDAMLVRAKVAALYVGVVVDPDGSGLADGDQRGSVSEVTMEPGAVLHVPPGKSIEFSDAPDQGGAIGLLAASFRMIAAGVGLTAEQVSGDYSQVNYSSARASLLEHRRFVETLQFHTVVPQLLRPVWQRFIKWQVLVGNIPAATYAADPAQFEAVDWLPPGWAQVDPLKAVQADIASINAGLKSRGEVIAERGLDAEDVDRQLAADAARLSRLSVTLNLKGGRP
jgi:lambda family phage portal protein